MSTKFPQVFDQLPKTRPKTPILDAISAPKDLRALSLTMLTVLADELRAYLLYCIGVSGGHFGANLGTVELTLALHYVLDTPRDKLVWDVGHQAYAHKVLTGRRDALPTIRTKDGLTAFPERRESKYDAFGVGHSSTAISAALGMHLVHRMTYHPDALPKVCAVVGDGAMTGGMAFEALGDVVAQDANMLIILNDNDMSISSAVGGFSQSLARLWHEGIVWDLDDANMPTKRRNIPDDTNSRSRHHLRSKQDETQDDNLFTALGMRYLGPYDGHDLATLVQIIKRALALQGPTLLHIHTQKGAGFTPALRDPIGFHALARPKADDADACALKIDRLPNRSDLGAPPIKFCDVFGRFLCDTAKEDTRMLGITPAMCVGSGMVDFARTYPNRFFDVAIAEQHALTLAAGMACEGAKPVVAIYSTFLQRGYDQLVHDIALQNLDVTLAVDRAGLVGEDGATHAGVFDIAYLRTVPNMVIAAPKDERDTYALLKTCYLHKGPCAVRYGRGSGVGARIDVDLILPMTGTIFGRVGTHKTKKIAVLAFGSRVYPAYFACANLANMAAFVVADMRFVKPLDTRLIDAFLDEGITHFVTVEEHQIMGGAGSCVNEYLAPFGVHTTNLGIPDAFIKHASHAQQLAQCRLDEVGIAIQLRKVLQTFD